MVYEGNDTWSFYRCNGEKIELTREDIDDFYLLFNEIKQKEEKKNIFAHYNTLKTLKLQAKLHIKTDIKRVDIIISSILKYHTPHIDQLSKTIKMVENIFLAGKSKAGRNNSDDIRAYYAELLAGGILPSEARKIITKKFSITDKTVQKHIYSTKK